MSEAVTIEKRLRRFAAVPDDADWQDVLRRAQVTAGRRDTTRRRPRVTRHRLVAAVVVVVALAAAAVAIAGHSLLGISNHGKRTHPGSFVLHELHWRAGLWKKAGLPVPDTARPGTFRQMALRQGIGVYIARSKKDNSLCLYEGQRQSFAGQPPNRLYLNGPGCDAELQGNFALPYRLERVAGRKGEVHESERNDETWLKAHPFPSPARPVLDMSGIGERRTPWPTGASPKPTPLPVPQWPKGSGRKGPILAPGQTLRQARDVPPSEWPSVESLVGVAVNRVRSMQVLALSDCHVVATAPVIHNVYIDPHLPPVADLFLVARDASGKVVWKSWPLVSNQYMRTPTERSAPRNCGLR
jgi:hypothetical protein